MDEFSFKAVIFDLDGVITNTAKVHAIAWKSMFDEFLLEYGKDKGRGFREFDLESDYLLYVDGKPRYKGVESFLLSRNIHIPFGLPVDSGDELTICGLGNRKNLKFNEILAADGVEVFPSTVQLIKELKTAEFKIAVASSSKNCRQVLERANLLHFFDVRVDGEISVDHGLKGKPEPDIFLESSRYLGVSPGESIVVEDAVSGVQAGVNGKFGLVIGIARENNQDDLKKAGAQYIVTDLSEIDGISGLDNIFRKIARL